MGNVRPDRVILLTIGAQEPFQSSIPKDVATLIRELPGIRRNAEGAPIAISQVLVYVQARDRDGTKVGFAMAGVTPGLTDYAPELHLTAGRVFRPGLRELIASNVCARRFVDFALGDKRLMRGGAWEVVGTFDMGSAEGICVVFADADTVLSGFSRDSYNQVNVMLQSVAAFTELTNAIKSNPMMRVAAKHEADLTEESMKQFNSILNFVSYFVGTIMAIAATLGAANSLYAIVDGRRRELATLSAIGFGSGPVIASMLTESIVLALPGALLGAALAWFFFNGFTASPFGFSFHLAVTLPVAGIGIGWALGMGVVGGLLPALKAARVSVTTALRAT
jgi:putative ABC transport system permease protein